MHTKILRTCTIVIQLIVIAVVVLADICGIVSAETFVDKRTLIESLVRSLVTLAFTIFYYVAVSDSFSSDSLFFPIYLLFLATTETRIIETVQRVLNLYVVSSQTLSMILIVSAFMLGLSTIGFCLLPNGSEKDTQLFTIISLTASVTIAIYGPKGQTISNAWDSNVMFMLLSFFYLIGIIISTIQTFQESATSTRIRLAGCILLLINNYVNVVFNSNMMNLVGTALYIVSIMIIVVFVKINSTKM